MSAERGAPARQPNPFALPSETNTRFTLMLVVALLLTAMLVYQALGTLGIVDWYSDRVGPRVPDIYVSGTSELRPDAPIEIGRIAVANLAMMGTEVLVLGLTLAVAFLLYRTHPRRIRSQKELTLWPENWHPDFLGALDDLRRHAGLSHTPVIVRDDNPRFLGGQVFGLRREYHMRLGKRMPLLHRKRPAAFRAVVLHELAHIANGDVGRTYFAQALWTAAIVPIGIAVILHLLYSVDVALSFILEGRYPIRALFALQRVLFTSLLEAGALLALLWITRAGLLRIRELYADWRAATWGADDALDDILQTQAAAEKSPGQWRRMWQLHPSAVQRLNTLRHPGRLFEISLDLPLVVGALQGLTLLGVYYLGSILGSFVQGVLIVLFYFVQLLWRNIALETISAFYHAGEVVDSLVSYAPFAVIGLLSAGTLGIQVERKVVSELLDRSPQVWKPYAKLILPAFLFALGVQISFWIVPYSRLSPMNWGQFYEGWLVEMAWFAYDVTIWILSGTFAVWIWLMLLRYLSHRLFGAHLGHRPPHTKRRILNLCMGVSMSVLLFAALQRQLYMISEDYNPIYSLGAFAAAIAAYVLTLGIGLGLIETGRRVRDRRCPKCRRRTRQRFAVGQDCEHCQLPLAPWAHVV